MEYSLTDKDYQQIYESAVREFNDSGIYYKQQYSNYLTRCMVKNILGFMKAKGIQVMEGKLYVTKEDN